VVVDQYNSAPFDTHLSHMVGLTMSTFSLRSWNPNLLPSTSTASRIRDPDLYFEDGNLILLVHDRLFKVRSAFKSDLSNVLKFWVTKVHKSVLKRKSTFFADLFDMGREESQRAEGHTDENPLILYEDDAECFHNMLYTIYEYISSFFYRILVNFSA
jgi:hypothetical protein